MQEIFKINNINVEIYWEDEIKIGCVLYVLAPGINEAICAIQLLLDQLDCRKFWYSNEVTFWDSDQETWEARRFQFKIIEANNDVWKDWSRQVIFAISTPNGKVKLN